MIPSLSAASGLDHTEPTTGINPPNSCIVSAFLSLLALFCNILFCIAAGVVTSKSTSINGEVVPLN